MAGTITIHGIKVPFCVDLLGFVYGPAEVALFASGLPEPYPAAPEQRLLSVLVERAKAHAA